MNDDEKAFEAWRARVKVATPIKTWRAALSHRDNQKTLSDRDKQCIEVAVEKTKEILGSDAHSQPATPTKWTEWLDEVINNARTFKTRTGEEILPASQVVGSLELVREMHEKLCPNSRLSVLRDVERWWKDLQEEEILEVITGLAIGMDKEADGEARLTGLVQKFNDKLSAEIARAEKEMEKSEKERGE